MLSNIVARQYKKNNGIFTIYLTSGNVLPKTNSINLPSLFKEFNLEFPLTTLKENKIYVTAYLAPEKENGLGPNYTIQIKQKKLEENKILKIKSLSTNYGNINANLGFTDLTVTFSEADLKDLLLNYQASINELNPVIKKFNEATFWENF